MAYLKRFGSLIALGVFMATPAASANFARVRATQVPVIVTAPPVTQPVAPVIVAVPVAPVIVPVPSIPTSTTNPGRPQRLPFPSPRLVVPIGTIFAS
ncbi:hypothetical protein BH11PAT2_BH11PAT2_09670 [soil metagenome]